MTGDAYRFWVAECRMGGCEACEILHRAPITRGRLKDLASVQETLDNAAFPSTRWQHGRTSGMESAPCGRPDGIGHLSLREDFCASPLGVWARDCLEQRAGVRMLRIRICRSGGSHLHNPS